MDAPAPDMAAFSEAIDSFRQKVGQSLQFSWPVPATYPEGTLIDPETAKPYDPTIEPEDDSVNQAECIGIVYRSAVSATHPRDDASNQPWGELGSDEAIFVISFADWEALELERATEVRGIGPVTAAYDITQVTTDSVGGSVFSDRVLIRGRSK